MNAPKTTTHTATPRICQIQPDHPSLRVLYMHSPKSSIYTYHFLLRFSPQPNYYYVPYIDTYYHKSPTTMARLSTLAALLVALLFIAQATAELTIVTTDVEDDTENRRQDDRDCRQQLQEQQYLNDCQRYLRQQSQQSEGFDTSSEREQRQQCCRQLKQLSRNCRCDGLNEMLRQLRGQLQGQELREMMQIAQNLPNECNIKPRSCEIEMRSSRI